MTAKTGQGPAAIEMHGSACGVVRQDIVKCDERVPVALERIEDHSIIGQSVGRSGLRPQRGGDQAQTFNRTALLVLKHATEMQGAKIVRVVASTRVVDLLRFPKMACLVESQGVLPRGCGAVARWVMRSFTVRENRDREIRFIRRGKR